jgi:hypothetical protein
MAILLVITPDSLARILDIKTIKVSPITPAFDTPQTADSK